MIVVSIMVGGIVVSERRGSLSCTCRVYERGQRFASFSRGKRPNLKFKTTVHVHARIHCGFFRFLKATPFSGPLVNMTNERRVVRQIQVIS